MRAWRWLSPLAAGLLLLAISGAAALAEGAAPPSDDPGSLSFAPLSISFPQPEKLTLRNGLVVYLFRDPELPIIDLSFTMKAGPVFDPADKAGLAEMAMTLLRTGGTSDMTPDEVDEALDFMPATVRLDAYLDESSGSLSALSARFPEALRIFAAMLRNPRFDSSRIEVAKARRIERIRRRWDDPGTIASLQFRRLAYGADSPWARLETIASIEAIGRQDLLDFHTTYVLPGNMVMGVAGDFEPAFMRRLLRRTFGSWEGGAASLPELPKVKDAIPVGVHLVQRPLTQSTIALGHLGVNRFDPDKFPLKIASYVLGEGGFSSRLMREVRSNRGLAYSVGGHIGICTDRGLFQIFSRTKAGATVEAIELIRDIVRRLLEEGPTEEEVRQAKEASINSMVFSVEGTASFMRSYLYYQHYGYPDDFLETYRDNLGAVTREQVQRAARRHLDPENLVILVVGDEGKLDRPLTALGLGDPRKIHL